MYTYIHMYWFITIDRVEALKLALLISVRLHLALLTAVWHAASQTLNRHYDTATCRNMCIVEERLELGMWPAWGLLLVFGLWQVWFVLNMPVLRKGTLFLCSFSKLAI